MKKSIIIFLVFCGIVFGEDYTATNPLQFLKIKDPFSYVSTYPSFENPSSFGRAGFKEISLSYNSYLAGIDISSISYVHPTEELGGFGINLLYLKTPDTIRTRDGGVKDEKFSCSDMLLTIGYGKKISQGIAIGSSFKFIREKIDKDSANTFCFDFGMQYKPFIKDITIGLCASNFGKSIKYIDEKEDLPITIKGGISINSLENTLTTSIGLDKSIDSPVILHLGVCHKLMNRIFLRAGYSTGQDVGIGLSFGLGFKLSRYFLDVSCLPFGELGNTISCSFSIKFIEEE
ncbi:TPA: hypothetical protein DCX16_07090 [bacterium]|nr:hypothetical protein [bacterium]